MKKRIRQDRKKATQPEKVKQAAKPVVSHPKDAECFTPLSDSWGGRIADTREQVSRRPMTDAELKQVRNLLRSLEGSWSGTLEDVTCVGRDATPPTRSYRYGFRLNARRQSDQIFETEADLVGEETGVTFRQFFWFLLSRDGLRFRSAKSDISFELDQPGNDVETLTLARDSLMFFWRRGGAVRKTNVFELRKVGRGFSISEFFYAQGTLAGKRVWEISR